MIFDNNLWCDMVILIHSSKLLLLLQPTSQRAAMIAAGHFGRIRLAASRMTCPSADI
jgi:hypothetical protein